MTDPSKAAAVPIAPGNYDRAWNDPPLFSYNEAAGHQKPSNKLNRRVGYPGASSGQALPPPGGAGTAPPSSSSLPDAGAKALPGAGMPLPPPPSMLGGSAPPTVPVISPTAATSDSNISVLSLAEVSSQLKNLMEVNSGSKSVDLTKRLDLMEKSLTCQSPVTEKITHILSDFTQLLERKDLCEAEKRLTTLGADYPAECAQWIICLRHLLADVKSKQKVDTTENPTDMTTPFFMPVAQTQ